MEDKKPIKTEAAPKATAQPSTTAHDSNPFTTAITGIKKLFDTNFSTLVALTLFSLLVFMFIVVIGVGMFIGMIAAAFFIAPRYFVQLYTMAPEFTHFASSLNLGLVYFGWAVGLVVILFLASLIQTLQIKLAYSAVTGQHIEFGDLLKQSTKRLLPLLGFNALTSGVMTAALFALFGMASVFQPLVFVALALSPVLFIVGMYVALRISLASFAIVNENLGPINAIKRSWAITQRHVGEVIGIVAASTLIVMLPTLLLQGIGRMLPMPVGSIVQLLASIIAMAISTILLSALAQRFVQLRAIFEGKVPAGKTHALNYLAIVFLFLGSMVIGALTPRPVNRSPYQDDNSLEEYYQDYGDGTETQYDYDYDYDPSQGSSDSTYKIN